MLPLFKNGMPPWSLLSNEQGNIPSVPQSNAEVWQQFITVMIVLALIIGCILILIKFIAKRDMPWMKNRALRSLGGIQLGQHKSMQIIDAGESVYVVGVGENVQLIDKISDPDELEQIRARFETQRPDSISTSFRQRLDHILAAQNKNEREDRN